MGRKKENITLCENGLKVFLARNPYRKKLGSKEYELTNHLGNVNVVITDKRKAIDATSDNITDYYMADVKSANDYFPFGMKISQRSVNLMTAEDNNTGYRFGFNGKEQDFSYSLLDGVDYDFGARMYDARLGRWMSCDSRSVKYPFASPYNFALNTPMQAKDPDGNVVLFISGQHAGDGGRAEYWRTQKIYKTYPRQEFNASGRIVTSTGKWQDYKLDQMIMNKIGDHAARYYDGASGGWANTLLLPLHASNLNYTNRIAAGAKMGYSQAAEIYSKLEDGETVKIVTHSMGTAYARGMVAGMQKWAKENNKTFTFEYELDIASFDGQNLPKPDAVNKLEYKSGDKDWVANMAKSLGFGKSSDIPNIKGEDVPKGTGHSNTDFNAKGTDSSINNNSAKEGSDPVYEANPK